jgi:hypothetical protein
VRQHVIQGRFDLPRRATLLFPKAVVRTPAAWFNVGGRWDDSKVVAADVHLGNWVNLGRLVLIGNSKILAVNLVPGQYDVCRIRSLAMKPL